MLLNETSVSSIRNRFGLHSWWNIFGMMILYIWYDKCFYCFKFYRGTIMPDWYISTIKNRALITGDNTSKKNLFLKKKIF